MVCLTLPRFGRALTRRPTSASVSPSENDSIFQAELRCEDMERFCIVLGGHPQIGGLVIIDTAGSKAVDRWNDANPGQKIEIGYAIIEVNGITKLQDMLQEFREAKVASILVQAELCPKQLAMLRTTIKIQRRKLLLQENLEDATFVTKCGETCSICHEEMDGHADASRLPCGHCFHKACVTKWLVYGSLRCPLCNHEVGRSDSQNNWGRLEKMRRPDSGNSGRKSRKNSTKFAAYSDGIVSEMQSTWCHFGSIFGSIFAVADLLGSRVNQQRRHFPQFSAF